MPCIEQFQGQDEAYRRKVLGNLPICAVEMGRPEIWCQFTGSLDRVIGVSRYGASAPGKVLAGHYGFTAEQIADRLAQML
jgi:transketolase